MIDPKFEKAYVDLVKRLENADEEFEETKGACKNCRWFLSQAWLMEDIKCLQPLVSQPRFNRVTDEIDNHHFVMRKWHHENAGLTIPDLCGSNRDLFQPKLTFLEKFMVWVTGESV